MRYVPSLLFNHQCYTQPTDSHLVVGMTNKLLSIKCMKKKGDENDDLGPSAIKRARAGSYKYFMRGMHYKPTGVYNLTIINFCNDAISFLE